MASNVQEIENGLEVMAIIAGRVGKRRSVPWVR